MLPMTVSSTRLLTAASALTLAGAMGAAGAAGYQIREQSAVALSNSGASAVAGAEDVSLLAFNPAVIGRLEGAQVAGTLSYIDPSFALQDAEASNAFGVPIGGDSDDGGKGALVPAAAAKWRVDERIDLGLGIYAPWGLATEYDRGWIGRYHAVESELATITINPVISFKPTPELTLAGGLLAQYADATLSSAIDFGTIGVAQGVPGASPGNNDGFVEINGDDWGFGYNLGLLYELTPHTRFGLSYRSKVDHTLDGNADFTADDAGVANVLRAAGGVFTDTGGTADLTTPAVFGAGVYHELTERWALMAGVEWTDWSEFEELVVEFDDNTPDSVTEENWDSTWMVSLGANYRINHQWLLRAGVGVDQTPVPDAEHRTPRIPDEKRTWLSVGATFTPIEELSITGGWLHLFIDDSDINQLASDEGNASRGNLSGEYEADANVFALQASYSF